MITVADIDALIEKVQREHCESMNGSSDFQSRRAYHRAYSRIVSQLEGLKAKALEVKP